MTFISANQGPLIFKMYSSIERSCSDSWHSLILFPYRGLNEVHPQIVDIRWYCFPIEAWMKVLLRYVTLDDIVSLTRLEWRSSSDSWHSMILFPYRGLNEVLPQIGDIRWYCFPIEVWMKFFLRLLTFDDIVSLSRLEWRSSSDSWHSTI